MPESINFIILSERWKLGYERVFASLSWQRVRNENQIAPAALSYHLKLLKNADLISEYKEKNFVYYEINTTVFDELIIWVNQFGGKKE